MKPQDLPRRTVLTINELRDAIIAGQNEDAVAIADSLIKKGAMAEQIIIDGITKAMAYLDEKCTLEQFCLLELMLAGRAAMDVIDYLSTLGFPPKSHVTDALSYQEKTIVLGTIKGDIHDIGKNIASMVMKSCGYKIIDVGKDAEPADFVNATIEYNAHIIGISSLITTTLTHVRSVKTLVEAAGLQGVKVVAGGAALQQSTAEYLNVDYVANTPFDAIHFIEGLQR